VLLAAMAVAVIAMAVQRNLFGVVVLFSIYSFLMATVLVALDAVDVAMTRRMMSLFICPSLCGA